MVSKIQLILGWLFLANLFVGCGPLLPRELAALLRLDAVGSCIQFQ